MPCACGSSGVRDTEAALTQPGEYGLCESQVKLLTGGGDTDSSDAPVTPRKPLTRFSAAQGPHLDGRQRSLIN